METTSVLFAVTVIGVLYLCVKYRYVKSALRFIHLTNKIPGPSLWEFCTVHAKSLIGDDMIYHLCKMTEEYGFKPWGFWFYTKYVVVVSDPDTLEELFKNKDLAEKSDIFYGEIERFLGKSIFIKGGAQHKSHRKILNPAFKKTLLESNQLPHINKEAKNIVQLLREEAMRGSVDVHDMIKERICDASMVVLDSGRYITPADHTDLCRIVKPALDIIQIKTVNPVYYWLVYRWTKAARQTESMLDEVKKYYDKSVCDAKKVCANIVRDTLNWEPSNAFDCMFKGQLEHGEEEFTDEDLKFEARIVVIGAFDPIAFVMNACMLVLAIHPHIQDRVFDEQHSIFGCSDRDVDPEDLSHMVYLKMVIKETLRLLHPGPILLRTVENETCLNGTVLPKGCNVILNLMNLHRHPDYYKDPLKFDPDRFRYENSEGRPSCAFIPFSVGPRTCLGQAQAMLFLRAILSHVVRNFQILPGDGFKSMDDIKVRFTALMQFKHCPSLRFIRRNS